MRNRNFRKVHLWLSREIDIQLYLNFEYLSQVRNVFELNRQPLIYISILYLEIVVHSCIDLLNCVLSSLSFMTIDSFCEITGFYARTLIRPELLYTILCGWIIGHVKYSNPGPRYIILRYSLKKITWLQNYEDLSVIVLNIKHVNSYHFNSQLSILIEKTCPYHKSPLKSTCNT